MFSVSSLEAVENPTNRSNVGVAVFITDPDKITADNYVSFMTKKLTNGLLIRFTKSKCYW